MTLSPGAVARQLGISPATLRTWAHRYGLEPSARSAGSHRRYTPEDIDRLVAMQRLMRSGVPAGQAAAHVRGLTPIAPSTDEPSDGAEPTVGRTRELWEAARILDGQRCAHLVADCVRGCGVLDTWDGLIRPVLQKAGEQWESTHSGIDVEHVLSDAVTAGLFIDKPVKREGVLLAATHSEDHVLPLYALRSALAERGLGAELLTARTPAEALGQAVARMHPAVVILWAQLEQNADPAGFAHLPRLRPRPALATAGPGWRDPVGPPHLGDLRDAVNFVRSHI